MRDLIWNLMFLAIQLKSFRLVEHYRYEEAKEETDEKGTKQDI